MWRRGRGGTGFRLFGGREVTTGSLMRGLRDERFFFQQMTRSIAGAAGDELKIQVDLILENELRKLIPNKQRKAKIKVPMTPLPTLQSLKKQVNHTFPNLKGISYGLRFVIPHKV
jgi:hypothetical protein